MTYASKILDTTTHYLGAMVTWHLGFVEPCSTLYEWLVR